MLLTAGRSAAQDSGDAVSDWIVQASESALSARTADADERLAISVIRLPSNAEQLADQLDSSDDWSIQLPARPHVPKGRLQVTVMHEGARQGTAVIQVAHFDSVAVLTTPVTSGAPVSLEDLEFVWMEVTRFSGEPLTREALSKWGPQELLARRSLKEDRPLRKVDIAPRPAAETGDPVRMVYRRGAFVLDLTCRARDRGQVGDIIRLYADDSDTVYRARLTAPGRAEWIETL